MFGAGSNIKSMAFVDNIASFLAFLASKVERHGVYNYADKPDFTVSDLVRFVDQTLGRPKRDRVSLPVPLATAAGHVADVVSFVLRRPLPLSAVRVQKFCALSEIDAGKAFATGGSRTGGAASGPSACTTMNGPRRVWSNFAMR
jgi:GlcNAc-P-P-Und epimerase